MTMTMTEPTTKDATLEAFIAGVPGVYPDIPADTYHAMEAASASRLKEFARSPQHCLYSIAHPYESTPAMRLGSASHLAILQPELFHEQYVAADQCSAFTRGDKRCGNPGKFVLAGEWFCGVHSNRGDDDRAVMSPDDFARCVSIHAAVWNHPAAAKAIAACTRKELSVVWTDKGTNQLCKLRADLVGDVAFDVKTTADASPEGFAWSIRKFKYDLQAAFYLRGLAAAGLTCNGFGFIAVESEAPHGVGVYAIDDLDLIDADHDLFNPKGLLAQYAACEKSGNWHGYSDQMRVIKLPWKRKDATV